MAGDAEEALAEGVLLGLLRLGAAEVVDVGGGADPATEGAAEIDLRHGAPEVPAIDAVVAPHAVLELPGLAAGARGVPRLRDGGDVVGVDRLAQAAPPFGEGVVDGQTGVVGPALVQEDDALALGDPDDLRHRAGEEVDERLLLVDGVRGVGARGAIEGLGDDVGDGDQEGALFVVDVAGGGPGDRERAEALAARAERQGDAGGDAGGAHAVGERREGRGLVQVGDHQRLTEAERGGGGGAEVDVDGGDGLEGAVAARAAQVDPAAAEVRQEAVAEGRGGVAGRGGVGERGGELVLQGEPLGEAIGAAAGRVGDGNEARDEEQPLAVDGRGDEPLAAVERVEGGVLRLFRVLHHGGTPVYRRCGFTRGACSARRRRYALSQLPLAAEAGRAALPRAALAARAGRATVGGGARLR